MKAVIQRVLKADVVIDGKVKSEIENGFMILLGIGKEDTNEDIEYLAYKISNLRVFEDAQGKMNLDIKQVGGSILLISQFTLLADTSHGNRPSFINAAPPDMAIPIYEQFIKSLEEKQMTVKTGEFGAEMKVSLVNDGPVTIIIDSKNK